MSNFIIKMPDIGEGIAEVEIVEWHVSVGDAVIEDQVLADVMTDKASVEIPSSVSGSVVSLGGDVGDVLAVGSDLIVINTESDADTKTVNTPVSNPIEETVVIPVVTTSNPATTTSNPATTISNPVATISNKETNSASHKVLASPSVRKRARQLGIDLTDLSNPSDTPISHSDLDAYLLKQNNNSSFSSSANNFDAFDYHERADKQVNVVGMRRQIAQKMQESKRNIPHFSYVEEIDVTELENLRNVLNKDASNNQPKLTLLPFIIKAMTIAIEKHPEVNARYDENAGIVTQYGAVHLGMATQTDRGLMVPVIHNAHKLDIWQCASQISGIAIATRSGKINREHLTGSTITLTSLGALGGIVSTPIINHPEVSIVGVNRILDKVVLHNGAPVIRKTMNLSSSFDHRIVDGMQAALYIQEIRRLLETPALLFVNHHP